MAVEQEQVHILPLSKELDVIITIAQPEKLTEDEPDLPLEKMDAVVAAVEDVAYKAFGYYDNKMAIAARAIHIQLANFVASRFNKTVKVTVEPK